MHNLAVLLRSETENKDIMTTKELDYLIGNEEANNYVYIFDMDGTLVNTDVANKLAYQQAAQNICNRSLFNIVGRMTRESLKYSHFSAEEENRIIEEKQRIYPNYLDKTILLPIASRLSYLQEQGCTIILATQSDKERAIQTLQYHHLEDYFTALYFKDDFDSCTNKFAYIIAQRHLNPEDVIVVEDNDIEIENAIKEGVKRDNIVYILKPFTIYKSKPYDPATGYHLTRCHVPAFYHFDYLRGHLTFINILKAEHGESDDYIEYASRLLRSILYEDIPQIYHLLGDKELVVCGIPRSKTKSSYSENQLRFNSTLSLAVQQMSAYYNLIDGGEYIIRHTDTPTTHLLHKDVEHVVVPVGITKDTCTIAPEIKDKDILLIDDIYTASVNIDEDAIQALYDNGARSVTFYAIARTKRIKE